MDPTQIVKIKSFGFVGNFLLIKAYKVYFIDFYGFGFSAFLDVLIAIFFLFLC